ncbi:uncharacterized protein [Diabrotica undecimpunctata]|uniref:uncharacterized protein isoform X3 n=1 Tax=Diabrotica undecimpunctata TaxID=50387 RepID=UPI003B64260A
MLKQTFILLYVSCFVLTGLVDRNIKNPIFDVFKSILPDFQISKHDNTEAIVENPAEPGVLDQDNEEGIPKDILSHLKHLHEIGIPNIHSLKDHIHHGHIHGAEDLPEDCPIDPVDVLCPEILPDCIEAIEDFLHCPEDEDIPVDEECLPIDPIHDCLDNDEDDADEDGTEEGDGEEDCPKDDDAEEDDAEEDGSEKEEPESEGTEVDSNVP